MISTHNSTRFMIGCKEMLQDNIRILKLLNPYNIMTVRVNIELSDM